MEELNNTTQKIKKVRVTKKKSPKIKEPKEPKTQKKEPKTQKKEPKTQKKEPKTQKKEPKTQKKEPKTQKKEPNNLQDIIFPVGTNTKCPKGTRKNKQGLCALTKEQKNIYLKRKACIQLKRENM